MPLAGFTPSSSVRPVKRMRQERRSADSAGPWHGRVWGPASGHDAVVTPRGSPCRSSSCVSWRSADRDRREPPRAGNALAVEYAAVDLQMHVGEQFEGFKARYVFEAIHPGRAQVGPRSDSGPAQVGPRSGSGRAQTLPAGQRSGDEPKKRSFFTLKKK